MTDEGTDMSPQAETVPPETARLSPNEPNPSEDAVPEQAADQDPILPPVISVIVPIFNEEEVIPELYRRMVAVLDGNRSTVGNWFASMTAAATTLYLCFSHSANRTLASKSSTSLATFGHQIAITAGMDYALGRAIAIIDADLQDPPELIGDMFEKMAPRL